MKFYTQYDRPEKDGFYEKVDKTKLVETAGYLPAKKRIENLMNAGQNLLEARKEMFDTEEEEVDFTEMDPTRLKSFDLADITGLERELERKLTEGTNDVEEREEKNDENNNQEEEDRHKKYKNFTNKDWEEFEREHKKFKELEEKHD